MRRVLVVKSLTSYEQRKQSALRSLVCACCHSAIHLSTVAILRACDIMARPHCVVKGGFIMDELEFARMMPADRERNTLWWFQVPHVIPRSCATM